MATAPGGFAGMVLRVDLSTGRISRESTVEKFQGLLGGTGIGYRVLWDEVPNGTLPFDPANKIVFATGVLAGTGVPCNGRTAVTTVFPHLPAQTPGGFRAHGRPVCRQAQVRRIRRG